MKIKRGQFVLYSKNTIDNIYLEQTKRVAIVVSNDSYNTLSPIVTIVPLSGKKLKKLPTHVSVNFEDRERFVLCERIINVAKEDVIPIDLYCTEFEMVDIEFALMIQLGIVKKVAQKYSQEKEIQNKILHNEAELIANNFYDNENVSQIERKPILENDDDLYGIGDIVISNKSCNKCLNNKWTIKKIENKCVQVKCEGCGEDKYFSIKSFKSDFISVHQKCQSNLLKENCDTKALKIQIDKEEGIYLDNTVKNINELQINKFGKILKNDDIVMLNENMKCKWCKNQVYRISDLSESISDKVKISCLNCRTEKNIGHIDFFNSIIETDKAKIFNSINSSFIAYGDGENRLKKTKNIYRDALDVVNSGAIFELQLIDSPKNHVTVGHDIENRSISIAYKEKGLIRTFKYKCHYCQTCKKYFDFGYSFDSQLKANGIAFDTLLLNLSKTELYSFLGNGFESFNSETFLHSQGYKVGYSGASSGTRKLILDRLIEQSLMTISEIKSVINNNIHRFSDRPGYEYAVSEWEDDIEYLNKKIK